MYFTLVIFIQDCVSAEKVKYIFVLMIVVPVFYIFFIFFYNPETLENKMWLWKNKINRMLIVFVSNCNLHFVFQNKRLNEPILHTWEVSLMVKKVFMCIFILSLWSKWPHGVASLDHWDMTGSAYLGEE